LVWVEADNGSNGGGGAIERMLVSFDDQLCRDACLEIRPDLDQGQSTLELLTRVKGSVGCALARRLTEQYPDRASWPQSLQTLIGRLDSVLSEQTR